MGFKHPVCKRTACAYATQACPPPSNARTQGRPQLLLRLNKSLYMQSDYQMQQDKIVRVRLCGV